MRVRYIQAAIAFVVSIFLWIIVNLFYQPTVVRKKVVKVEVPSASGEVVVAEPDKIEMVVEGGRFEVLKYLQSVNAVIWDGYKYVYPSAPKLRVVINAGKIKIKRYRKVEKEFDVKPVVYVDVEQVERINIFPSRVKIEGLENEVKLVKTVKVPVKKFGRSIEKVDVEFKGVLKVGGFFKVEPPYVLIVVEKKRKVCVYSKVKVLVNSGDDATVECRTSPEFVKICGYGRLPSEILIDMRNVNFKANNVFPCEFESLVSNNLKDTSFEVKIFNDEGVVKKVKVFSKYEVVPKKVRVFVRVLRGK